MSNIYIFVLYIVILLNILLTFLLSRYKNLFPPNTGSSSIGTRPGNIQETPPLPEPIYDVPRTYKDEEEFLKARDFPTLPDLNTRYEINSVKICNSIPIVY